MKTIMIQKESSYLNLLRNCVKKFCPKCSQEIVFTEYESVVLKELEVVDEILVISGQRLSGGHSASWLACEVKKSRPDALFYVYSVLPEEGGNECIDGAIEKNMMYGNTDIRLAKILAENLDLNETKILLDAMAN